jgi:hypothetical protein
VWVDYFRGKIPSQTAKLDLLLGREPLAIGDLILTGSLKGFNSDWDFHNARRMDSDRDFDPFETYLGLRVA